MSSSYDGFFKSETVTIPSGQAVSGSAAATDGRQVVGMITPANWTAADISFQVSYDGVSFYPLYFPSTDGLQEYVIIPGAVTGAYFCPIDPTIWMGVRFVKIVSGRNGAGVNQAADRNIQLVMRPVS